MNTRIVASKGLAALMYVAYALLPVGLATLAGGWLQAQGNERTAVPSSLKSSVDPTATSASTPPTASTSNLSSGATPAWTHPADTGRASTSSAQHARREADRTVNEPPGIR